MADPQHGLLRSSFPDSCDPKCPICQQDLYGQQAIGRWPMNCGDSEWMSNAIFDVPNLDSLAPDSLATLDDDTNYGQDDSSPQ
ncbi:MAG: hypothetical protein R3C56_02360 [Pirellulaceae bacterium]